MLAILQQFRGALEPDGKTSVVNGQQIQIVLIEGMRCHRISSSTI